jgi:hypothetical protein
LVVEGGPPPPLLGPLPQAYTAEVQKQLLTEFGITPAEGRAFFFPGPSSVLKVLGRVDGVNPSKVVAEVAELFEKSGFSLRGSVGSVIEQCAPASCFPEPRFG